MAHQPMGRPRDPQGRRSHHTGGRKNRTAKPILEFHEDDISPEIHGLLGQHTGLRPSDVMMDGDIE